LNCLRGNFGYTEISDNLIVSFADKEEGFLNILDIAKENQIRIQAEKGVISFICLSSDGKYVATTSNKGYYINIFEIANGKLFKTLHRNILNENRWKFHIRNI
jgi:tricorn protease-like protein